MIYFVSPRLCSPPLWMGLYLTTHLIRLLYGFVSVCSWLWLWFWPSPSSSLIITNEWLNDHVPNLLLLHTYAPETTSGFISLTRISCKTIKKPTKTIATIKNGIGNLISKEIIHSCKIHQTNINPSSCGVALKAWLQKWFRPHIGDWEALWLTPHPTFLKYLMDEFKCLQTKNKQE